jgi:hypothetical protein
MNMYVHLWTYLAQFFFKMKDKSHKVVEKIETNILCSITFSPKLFRVLDNVEKHCRAGQATDDNTA